MLKLIKVSKVIIINISETMIYLDILKKTVNYWRYACLIPLKLILGYWGTKMLSFILPSI